MAFAFFQIKSDDGLPDKLCLECALQASKLFSFKLQVEQSDAALRERLSFKFENSVPNDSTEPIKLDKEENEKIDIKKEIIEATPDDQSDADNYFPPSDSSSDTEWDDDPDSKTKLSELKLKQQESNESTEKIHHCDLCNKTFNRTSHLRRHFKTKAHLDLIKGEPIKGEPGYTPVRYKTAGRKTYTCHVCQKLFNRNSHLVRHLRVHSDAKPFECLICSKRFVREDLLIRHQIVHTVNVIKEEDLEEKADEDVKYSCTCCERVFNKKESLASHMRTHTNDSKKIMSCDVCRKTFTKSSHLTRHIKIHSKIKPHICQMCGKGFARGKFKENFDAKS